MSWAQFYSWCNAHLLFPWLPAAQKQAHKDEGAHVSSHLPTRAQGWKQKRKMNGKQSKPSLKELNKATELDKMVSLTFGPAVSALEAITSWLCFCDPASGLWEKAGSQRPLPRAGRGAGERSLQDSQWGDGFRHIVRTSISLLFYYFVIWASMNLSKEGMIQ